MKLVSKLLVLITILALVFAVCTACMDSSEESQNESVIGSELTTESDGGESNSQESLPESEVESNESVIGSEETTESDGGESDSQESLPESEVESNEPVLPNTYTVTWKDGDTVLKTVEVEENALLVYDGETPAKDGYTFVKWQINGEDVSADAVVTETLVVDAVWAANTYTLTWGEGGETVTVTYDEEIGQIPAVSATEKKNYYSAWTIDGIEVTAETVWNYVEDKTATEKYFSEYFNVNSGNVNYEDVTTVDDSGKEIGGLQITSADEAKFEYNGTVDFDTFNGTLIKFRTTNTAQSNPLREMSIKIIDAENENNVITINFFRNGDSDFVENVYVNVSYKDFVLTGNKGLVAWMNFAGVDTQPTYSVPNYVEVKYDSATQTLTVGDVKFVFGGEYDNTVWGQLVLGAGTEITGFANGAKIEISFDNLDSESGIIVNNINNLPYNNGEFENA